MKAPFQYFGGKSTIANVVWEALGQPAHYIEPFFGSGAVLLNRPDYNPTKHIETVCDKDGFVANVWRAIQFSPEETARWCDLPVNHADLMARKAALLKNENRLLENLVQDDRWHDPIMAGYWIWAASCWIGSGLTRPTARPHLGDGGMGVHAIGKRPHASDDGKGVHAQNVSSIYQWFDELSCRLRRVRVVCGDWTRVCGGSWQNNMGTCGMFFDPPYSDEKRDQAIYHCESMTVSQDVETWAMSRADNPDYHIVIAGYEGEHDGLAEAGWRVIEWKTNGGYSKLKGEKNANCRRERLWISPNCFSKKQATIFDFEKGD